MSREKTALVLGCGESGAAAAHLLQAEGFHVVLVDEGLSAAVQARASRLEAEGIEVRLSCKTMPAGTWDLAVISPGWPLNHLWISELRNRGVEIVSELELGWTRRTARVVAITGTNGKSTATKWMGELLAAAGYRVGIGGNYGTPACSLVLQGGHDWMVLEVSSFQLESARRFRAEIGILLNIYPNHLDRHASFEEYQAAKARLFANTRDSDVCVVHFPAAGVVRELSHAQGRWVTFGLEADAMYRFEAGNVRGPAGYTVEVSGTWFDNPILGQTAAAIAAAAQACGIEPKIVETTARSFLPLPHRMQLVLEKDGVRYVDDSKATSLSAMVAAIQMVKGPVRLIAGGLLKERDLSSARHVLRERVRSIYLIGSAAQAMYDAWSDCVRCVLCGTLERAVETAVSEVQSGETVLLSPACASFDQFESYKQRGEMFAKYVQHFLDGTSKKGHRVEEFLWKGDLK